ncbi:MAG: extracellular solute-binding protein [Gemmatimonadales bacterium]|nr:extracellular solute-binding protein [Gemmatimonadales bacterium]
MKGRTGGRSDGRTGGALLRRLLPLVALLSASPPDRPSALAQQGPLTVFNAGSLARPVGEVLKAFKARFPKVDTRQENAGSLETVRKITDLGKVPDVVLLADYQLIPRLLEPEHASWHAVFARNAMVLAYTDRSKYAREIRQDNWWRVLTRPDVRTGRSDPALDPNGYRTLMVLQLLEAATGEIGLGLQLERAMPPKYMRPKEADLIALLQAGELDYAWSYASIAGVTPGLRMLRLGPAVDLSESRLARQYSLALVKVRGPKGTTLTLTGEPIAYGFTIPRRAPNPEAAKAFTRFLFSPEGRAILTRNGLDVMWPIAPVGPAPLGVFP